MPSSIEKQFDEQIMTVYENGKRFLNYNATRFLQKIRKDGGVAAAKSWLKTRKNDKPTKGFLRLVDSGRLDISLEALVLKNPWNNLFTSEELDVARQRLSRYGYFDEIEDSYDNNSIFSAQEVKSKSFYEGAVHRVTVNRYERNLEARKACIKYYGAKCYVCEFDFAAHYGLKFDGFIHVHHLCSLASIGVNYEIDPIADLRPVCPNCHVVIHTKEPCYTIEEVKKILKS